MLLTIVHAVTTSMVTYRPRKSVQCPSDPEFTFSNVPRKCVKTTGKFEPALRVHYRTISAEKHSVQSLELDYVGWTSVRKQNNLQILLTGYEKHFSISNDK